MWAVQRLDSLRGDLAEIISVEEYYGNRDVIAEHPNDVGRQRQQLEQLRVVDSVVAASERVSNKMCRCVLINWL